jgi:hypothetical protein
MMKTEEVIDMKRLNVPASSRAEASG